MLNKGEPIEAEPDDFYLPQNEVLTRTHKLVLESFVNLRIFLSFSLLLFTCFSLHLNRGKHFFSFKLETDKI